ncbi:hypothetical protein IPZ61_11035, partial [Streptomyces sioyaensis]|nr:hypothetical protein [Streptomyces sioyaensis]
GLAAVGYWVWCARHVGAERAAGAGLLALVVAAPVAQPWYVLWALVPLAAADWRRLARPGAKAAVVALTLVVMPSGQGPTWASGCAAAVGAGLALAVVTTGLRVRPVRAPAAVLPGAAARVRR